MKSTKMVMTGFIFLIASIFNNAQAGSPVWTFQPLTATTITVPDTGSATIQYLVTNHSRREVNLTMQPIRGVVASGCERVAGNQSCTLTLQLIGAQLPLSVIGGPVLCNRASILQCYRPDQPSELHVTRVSQSVATLLVTGSPLFLTPGSVGYLTVTNTGTAPGTNIMATLPPGLAVNMTQDASDCVVLPAGQSCHLQFTAQGQMYPATSVNIAGATTNTQTATLTLDYPYITNGEIFSVIYDGLNQLIYLGGDFSTVGPNTGGGVPIDINSGQRLASFPRVNGSVTAIAADGTGGWYIGGSFESVGTTPRNDAAHILSDYSVDPNWNPNPNNAVLSLIVDGGLVYIGGEFTNIGGQNRNRIAALDATTGNATAWNPNASGPVNTILVDGLTTYVGGQFVTIGGQPRNNIAALVTATGLATAWDPDADSTVWTLLLDGGNLYVGGQFGTIGGQARNHIAALDVATGNAIVPWDPNADGTIVYSLAINGTTLYAGGNFDNIGGQARSKIAGLDTVGTGTGTGDATGWVPPGPINDEVTSLILDGTILYTGGRFTSIGVQTRNNIAAIDLITGLTNWDPVTDGDGVERLALDGTTIYVGGSFASINAQLRDNIAALSASTAQATAWNPSANNIVYTLALDGSTIYAGGDFTTIGGQGRNHIAALDTSTGLATVWNPNADSQVRVLTLNGSLIYAGGTFTTIGGQGRNYIAALDTANGLATAWDPSANVNVNTIVYAIAVNGSTVYAGGNFTSIGGQARNHIAALDAAGTGLATPWNPNSDAELYSLLVDGSTVYAGGDFTSIGGQPRNYIAALNAAGLATAWNPNANAAVKSMMLSASTLYVGGDFSTIGGQARVVIAALSTATGLANLFNENVSVDGDVNSLALSASGVYFGGLWSSINDIISRNFSITPMDLSS